MALSKPPPPPPSLRCLRPFSTTSPTRKPTTHPPAPRYTNFPPPYPYGPAHHYKQSDTGLYGGATIQFGNQVSEKNRIKTRRVWRLNVHRKRLWSDSLNRFVRVKVQARVLRTIDKCGGLDEYLLGDKPRRIKELGVEGWRLRWLVMRTETVRARFDREREALGLPTKGGTTMTKAVSSLRDEVERASGALVARLRVPEFAPSALEPRVALLAHAIETETARLSSAKTDTTRPDRPARRYTKGEKRAWRAKQAQQALNTLHLDSSDIKVDFARGEEAVREEVARMEEAVRAEMEGAGEQGRERLEAAMEGLRRAAEKFERVTAGPVEQLRMAEEAGKPPKEGWLWSRIMGIFRRR